MPMRSMWKGAVSFGLVSIPVNLYVATESRSVTFHQVHAEDGGRVQTKRVCSVDGAEVPYRDIAKGHETADGTVVVLTDDDFATLQVPSTKAVDVLEFVPLEAVDPIYFDKTYFLEPQKGGIKPYLLLRDALHKSGHVAVAKIALRQRESLALLRVHADCLVLSTMLWPDEVRAPDFAFLREDAPPVRDAELAMAGSLIDSMSDDVFDPRQYQDTYRLQLEALIDRKVAGKEAVTPPTADDTGGTVIDLMSALTASIEASRRTREGSGAEPTTAPAAKKAPVAKAAATKAAAKKTPATKKTPAVKAAAKKTPATKAASTKAPATKAAASKKAAATQA
jgi:DNA end-binding protein Ku